MRSMSTDHMPPSGRAGDTAVRVFGQTRDGYRPRATTLERSRAIREAAARFIGERGLWRFSMLSLSRALDCLLPTLCYYYKRREELVTDIVLRHVETLRLRTGLAMESAEEGSPNSELHAFAREYLLVVLAEPDFHRLYLSYPVLASRAERETLHARQESVRECVETRLTAHAPALAGTPETARALSHALLDLLNGAIGWMEPYGVVRPAAYAAMAATWALDQAGRS